MALNLHFSIRLLVVYKDNVTFFTSPKQKNSLVVNLYVSRDYPNVPTSLAHVPKTKAVFWSRV